MDTSLNFNQRWQAPNVKVCFFRDFTWIKKTKNILGQFWLGIFIQDNLPMNLKRDIWPISQLLSEKKRKKRPVLSIEVPHPATCRLLLLLYLYTRTKSAKAHGNINKEHLEA